MITGVVEVEVQGHVLSLVAAVGAGVTAVGNTFAAGAGEGFAAGFATTEAAGGLVATGVGEGCTAEVVVADEESAACAVFGAGCGVDGTGLGD